MHAPRSLGAYGLTLVLGLFGATGVVNQCSPPPVSAPIDISYQCTDMVNSARAQAGVAAVTVVAAINQAAQGQSSYQASIQKMTHTGADGSNAGQRIAAQGYAWSTWAENVAAGQVDCASVMSAWMGSAGHRANILNPAMTSIGVGAVKGTNGVIYWTMDFAAPA